MTRSIVHAAVAAATVVTLAAAPGSAAAATFSVNPTQIFLQQRATSALLSLRNDSDQTLRFELSVFTWTQNAKGEMTLEPTKDIVFFPSLLTLEPSEERKVRVGRVAAAGARENTYRIFVKELPPVDNASGAGVRVLTTMGIPIFVRPEKETSSAELTGLQHTGGKLDFVLANTGSVHFVPQTIQVRGLARGVQAFETSVDGWYVLAAGRREFAVDLPQEACSSIDSLMIHVEIASAILEERLQTPGGTCER